MRVLTHIPGIRQQAQIDETGIMALRRRGRDSAAGAIGTDHAESSPPAGKEGCPLHR
jgi:hypothetical protein